jgi:hypothetical protein
MTVRADVATLRLLRYCVCVTDSVLRPGDPTRDMLPDVLDWLDAQISRARNDSDDPLPELNPTDLIGSAAAAAILGITQRRVQQIADDLGGRKVNGDGPYVFSRAAVIAHRDARKAEAA